MADDDSNFLLARQNQREQVVRELPSKMVTLKEVELFTCVRCFFLRKLVDCAVLKGCVFKLNNSTQQNKQQKHVRRDGQNSVDFKFHS